MTYTEVYDNGTTRAVARSDSVCLTAGQQYIYITPEELADIGKAVAQHLESAAEPFFTEEDLEVGRRAIAELEVP